MRSALFVAVILVGCGRDKQPNEGLPPGQQWSANAAGQMVKQGELSPSDLPPPAPPPGMANPHGGGGAPGASADPHAGLGIDPADPHAGMGRPTGSPDVTQMGLAAPDPNRAIDSNRYVKGVIKIHEKARSRTKPGTALFIVVKRADANGAPSGAPLAVDKLEWNAAGELAFTLTEAEAMVAGTELTGDVFVTARYDQDSDAISKEPGDITGQTRVTLPADNVTVVLDTVL